MHYYSVIIILVSGLFGIAFFSWHLYSHSVHCNNKNCSNNIHSHSFVCTNTILLLFVDFILFFSDVCLSDSHRLEQFLAATTTMR